MSRLGMLNPAVLLTGLFFGLCACGPAMAQEVSRCAERAVVLDWLQQVFGEQQRFVAPTAGVGEDAALFEVFSSPASGSWTIIMTNGAGVTCLLAAGTGFVIIPEGDPA